MSIDTIATDATENLTHLRNADLAALAQALNDTRVRSVDVIARAKSLSTQFAAFDLTNIGAQPVEDGVLSNVDGFYVPTPLADGQLASRLNVPGLTGQYLRHLRSADPGLYDANVNRWLSASDGKLLLRLLTGANGQDPDGAPGRVRAVLSDSYRCIDNFDVVVAALRGLREGGLTEDDMMVRADLTERRMLVRVMVPSMYVMAERLLADYRNPWTQDRLLSGWTPEAMARHNEAIDRMSGRGATDPIIFAGMVISNSETGGGAFNVYPELTVRVCLNGLTITADALKRRHVGAKLDEGIVVASDRTVRANLELVASQTADITRTVLSRDYVAAKVADLEESAGIAVNDAPKVITSVSKTLGFSKAEADEILSMFIRGGQMTAGGVMQAVTATAQTLDDADAAWNMSLRGIEAMYAAAAVAR